MGTVSDNLLMGAGAGQTLRVPKELHLEGESTGLQGRGRGSLLKTQALCVFTQQGLCLVQVHGQVHHL